MQPLRQGAYYAEQLAVITVHIVWLVIVLIQLLLQEEPGYRQEGCRRCSIPEDAALHG